MEGEDRRVKRLRLTATGDDLMRQRRQSRIQRAAQALEAIPDSERAAILRTLELLLAAASASAPAVSEDPVCVRVQH